MSSEFLIVSNTLAPGLKKYFKVHDETHEKAAGAMGLQLLNNIVNGSPSEPVVPPKKTGHLRASGSTFVGNKLIGDTSNLGGGSPNKSHSDDKNTVTVGFDTPYAAWLHENTWTPGPVSEQSGDVGNKYIERHLKADGPELMELYAAIQKKAAG